MADEAGTTEERLKRPLEGLRVLDLTVALAGPYCSLLLAGLGAEVIKVEGPDGGDIARNNSPYYGPNGFEFERPGEGDVSISILARARNKKSITLDLKSEDGRALFMQLAAQSDILVENMSEGTVDRLGVGYSAIREINDRLVYASISGLGEPSPIPGLKAMDIIVQAMSGLMDVTGLPGGSPMRVGIPIGDLIAPLFAVSGILAAVIQRQTTGVGQHVKVSMLDTIASLLAVENFDILARQGLSPRTGNHLNRLAPFGLYETLDGHVAIAAVTDVSAHALFDAMGRRDLIADPRFNGRAARAFNADILNATIETWTQSLATADVFRELHTLRKVSCAPLRTAEEVLRDPALHAKGAIQKLAHPRYGEIDAVGMGIPISFSGARVGLDRPAPELGADNAQVFGNLLGLSTEDISNLVQRGVIGGAPNAEPVESTGRETAYGG